MHLTHTGLNIVKECQLIIQFYRIYHRLAPEFILQYTIKPNVYGTLAANRLRYPVINNISGLGTAFIEGGWLEQVMWKLYGWVFPLASHNFFQNTEDETLIRKRLATQHFRSSTIPGSGIDVSYFAPRKRQRAGQIFTFLMVGRLIVDKGTREYAQAAEICKKNGLAAQFLLVGPYDSAHRRAISEKELKHWQATHTLIYLGERRNMRALLAQADCVVLPSYREGLPRSLLEAAAMGKALIASNVPGCRAIVREHYNGLLCQVKSGEALAQAFQTMRELSEVRRKRMGKNSRALVLKHFNQRIVFDAYVQKINEITTAL